MIALSGWANRPCIRGDRADPNVVMVGASSEREALECRKRPTARAETDLKAKVTTGLRA